MWMSSRISQRIRSRRNQQQRDGLLHHAPVHATPRAVRDPRQAMTGRTPLARTWTRYFVV